jgi:hypothetical protein
MSIENENGNFAKPMLVAGASKKPTMEKYGYHSRSGFDDLPSGWMFEGGEEAYYEALKKWEAVNGTALATNGR